MIFKEELCNEMDGKDCSLPRNTNGNGGMLVLAEAVSGEAREENEGDGKNLSLEETGAAEELLALASEASLSSPINRNDLHSPYEKENESTSTPSVSVPTNGSSGILYGRRHVCNNCGATSTPFWRKSHDGLYYCNACGLYLRTHNAMRPPSLSKNRESRRSKTRPEACSNCNATDTPMWRKTEDGMIVCNACGLYHKLHGQHRKLGTRRSVGKGATDATVTRSPPRKQALTRNSEFTLVRENSQFAARNKNSSEDKIIQGALSSGNNSLKYSLDAQYHHKFDPNRSNNSNKNANEVSVSMPISSAPFPMSQVQPVDTRKLAYLKSSQGRTPLLAPKMPPIDPQQQVPSIYQHASSYGSNPSVTPPILTNFINSLASTSTEHLSLDQVEHPLQPLLTSIVSQKLKEQKRRTSSKSVSPSSMMMLGDWNAAGNNENSQLAEFIQNQQEVIYNQQIGYGNNAIGIYNADNGHVYEYDNTNAANNYNLANNYNSTNNYNAANNYYQQIQHLQLEHPQHQHQHRQHGYYNQTGPFQYPLQSSVQQYPQNPAQYPQQYHHPQYNQHYQTEAAYPANQQTPYFNSDFTSDLPTRQLSPFSGIKFDKNLIDLVNMQFWQEPGVSGTNSINGNNPENEITTKRNVHPSSSSSIDDVIQDMPSDINPHP